MTDTMPGYVAEGSPLSDPRRRTDRAPLALKAELELPAGTWTPARLGNMGPDGAFIECDSTVAPGDRVQVRFVLDSFPVGFEVPAEVRWRREVVGFGVQFIGLCGYDRAALDDYCQRRLEAARATRGLDGEPA